eukprot:CAMPEP_0170271390 /NCGR_PEP_ID=MMETSP0116_2-20130129/35643_1 /TAXON_ID=400756 /ORGANISM="Durinskia baltica, Strain CSIRO CS-38" /LENGTH=42 /DNA_ID= /DNA_START= /DNA_END= /DNA_ORIENTATION=
MTESTTMTDTSTTRLGATSGAPRAASVWLAACSTAVLSRMLL